MKLTKILIIVIIIVLVFAFIFGANKLGDIALKDLSSDPSSDDDGSFDTWYAANLPGAEQLLFRDFNTPSDISRGGIAVYDPRNDEGLTGSLTSFNTDNGYLEFRHNNSDFTDFEFVLFPSFNTVDYSVLPVISADVIVIDFDFWHPFGKPETYFTVNSRVSYMTPGIIFTDYFGTEMGESGINAGDYGYSVSAWDDVNNQAGLGIYSLGDDYSAVCHLTLMIFDDRINYYVDGQFIYSSFIDSPCSASEFRYLSITAPTGAAVPGQAEYSAIEYGSFCMDNFEIVKFGTGDGSYSGILNNYKTNTSLDLSELID